MISLFFPILGPLSRESSEDSVSTLKLGLPHVLQRGQCQRGAEQQQRDDVGVEQQGAGQTLQRVQGQHAKGLLAQIQVGIEIPGGGWGRGRGEGGSGGKVRKQEETMRKKEQRLHWVERVRVSLAAS